MEKLFKKTIVFICIYHFFLTGFAFATENSMLVELPQKIIQSFANIKRINHQYDLKTKQLETQIQGIVQEFQNAKNEEHIYSIQQEYLAYRAEGLKEEALKLVGIEKELISAIKNMTQLEQVRNDSRKFGIGAGIDRNDIEAKQAVKGMLKGFQSVLNMVDSLNPEANLSNLQDTFGVMTSMAKSFYTNPSNVSMEFQKKFILESLSFSKSLQGLLGSEHDYLLTRLYYIDSNHIVKQFGKIKLAILGSGIGISDGLKKYHRMDEKVLNSSNPNTLMSQKEYNAGLIQTNFDW